MKNLKALVAVALFGVAVLGFSKKSAACVDNSGIPNIGTCQPYGGYVVCVYGGFTCDRTDVNQEI